MTARTRRIYTTLAIVVAAWGISFSTPASARQRHRCVTHGGTVFSRDRHAIAYRDGSTKKVYGCLLGNGKTRFLPTGGGFIRTGEPSYVPGPAPRVAGRFVAYVVPVEEQQLTPTHDFINVYDLRTGRLILRARGHSYHDTGSLLISAFVLRGDGVAAWIASGREGFRGEGNALPNEVHEAGPAKRGRVLDSGSDIDPSDLSLSQDRTTAHWTKAGQPRTARL